MYCCLQFQLNFIDGGSNLSKHSDDYRYSLTGEPFYSNIRKNCILSFSYYFQLICYISSQNVPFCSKQSFEKHHLRFIFRTNRRKNI